MKEGTTCGSLTYLETIKLVVARSEILKLPCHEKIVVFQVCTSVYHVGVINMRLRPFVLVVLRCQVERKTTFSFSEASE